MTDTDAATGRPTAANNAHWAMRCAVIDVVDLERSTRFYETVMGLGQVAKEDRVAVLSEPPDGVPVLVLRQSYRNAVHAGEQAIGLRALAFDVGGTEQLERVEQRLRDLGGFVQRAHFGTGGRWDYVQGHDPDRLPLWFLAISGRPTPADYRESLHLAYDVDV